MSVFAHLSDLHFGREIPSVSEALIRQLKRIKPELIIISGDLTQRARQAQYIKAQEFLRELPAPYLVIPGNHDLVAINLLERFTFPWKKWRRYVGVDLEPEIQTAGAAIKGVNTVRRLGAGFDWSRGSISETQVNSISQAMSKAPSDRLRLVVSHHPFWMPELYAHRNLIEGGRRALPYMKEAGVDLILSGHIHVAFAHVLDGVIISHAGTAVSSRLRRGHPNSFNLLSGNTEELTITLMQWHVDDFQEAGKQTFGKHNGSWDYADEHVEQHRQTGSIR
ncbi:MAG: metallophosphoesterase [Gammaproteobacteria bacterium]|nr:metallophosphoesterase [Gammaproteobacteria bacterium]